MRLFFAFVVAILVLPLATAIQANDAGLGRDASNTISGAEPVGLGTPYDASVGNLDDPADWFVATSPANGLLRITLLMDQRVTPCLKVYRADLSLVLDNRWDCDRTSSVDPREYMVSGSSSYYLKFAASDAVNYTFLLSNVETTDYAASIEARPAGLPHQVDVIATVTNLGGSTGSFSVQLKNDGNYGSCWWDATLSPGQTATFSAASEVVGGNGFEVTVRSWGPVVDLQTNNNYAHVFYTVGVTYVREQIAWRCG